MITFFMSAKILRFEEAIFEEQILTKVPAGNN